MEYFFFIRIFIWWFFIWWFIATHLHFEFRTFNLRIFLKRSIYLSKVFCGNKVLWIIDSNAHDLWMSYELHIHYLINFVETWHIRSFIFRFFLCQNKKQIKNDCNRIRNSMPRFQMDLSDATSPLKISFCPQHESPVTEDINSSKKEYNDQNIYRYNQFTSVN